MKDFCRLFIILCLIAANSYFMWSQPMLPGTPDQLKRTGYSVIQKSNRDSLIAWQEKVLLHLADDHALNNSMIFFKGYLLTGPKNLRVNMSKVLKVELLDQQGEVVINQYHPIEEGMFKGNLGIPKKLPPGQYFLRAYTRWMQNYGERYYTVKPVYIGNPKRRTGTTGNAATEVHIYPEGGSLLNGQLNRVVLKVNQAGANVHALTAQIKDQQGKVASTLTAYPPNYLAAAFEPQPGKVYSLEMSDGHSYPMPAARDKGCLLQINNLDSEMVRVRIMGTPDYQGAQLKLIGDFDGVAFLERYINFNDREKVEFEIPKKELPRGILWLRLLDHSGLELSARPVWIDGGGIKIDVRPLSPGEGQSGEIVLEVEVTDLEDNPIETEVALSITRNLEGQELSKRASNGFDEFDLFPTTGSTEYYKESTLERKGRFLKDLSLLSSATEINRDLGVHLGEEENIIYTFQAGLELIGYAYDMENKLLRNTPIQVMAFAENDIWVQDIQTDSEGRIALENLQLKGEAELVFRVEGDQSKERMVKVIPAKNTGSMRSTTLEKEIKSQEKKRIFKPTDRSVSDTTGMIELEEVVVRELASKKPESPSVYNIHPSHVRFQDPKRPKSIPELLLNIPNIRVIGIGTLNPVAVNIRSEMAGGGPILYVLDGMTLTQGDGRGGLGTIGRNPLVEIMNLVPSTDVERIEFLLGPEAATFGSRSNGGVLLFYTRTGAELRRSQRKEAQLMFQGYELPIDFMEYKETESKKVSELSSMLYWNPQIQTDKKGKASITIPFMEYKRNRVIKASAVTKEGQIGKFAAPLD